MIKRMTALMLGVVICFSLCACSADINQQETTEQMQTTTSVSADTQGTAIIITTTNPALQTTEITTTEFTTTEVTTEATTAEITTEAMTTEAVTTEVTTTELTTAPQNNYTDYNGSTPLLYKVTDDKGNYIWLFGTIHVGRADYYPLPDYVNKAFEQSDALAVEIDITKFSKNYLAQIYALKKLTYDDKSSIKEHIPEETYNKAVAILKENGMYSESIEGYKPVLWSNFIDNASIKKLGADSSLGVDVHLINRAKEMKKSVLQVESAGQQYAMLGGFSEALQVLMLQSSINSYGKPDKVKADLEEMMDMWYKGNEAEFTDYLRKETDNSNEVVAALMAEYNKAMFTDRNKKMTDYAVKKLSKGEKVFICVGAAHVIGDDGMVKRLRDMGYTVEIVR